MYLFDPDGKIVGSAATVNLARQWLFNQPVGARVAAYVGNDPYAWSAWKVIRGKNGKPRIVQDYNAPLNPL